MLRSSLAYVLPLVILCLSAQSFADQVVADLQSASKAGLYNSFKGQYVRQTNSGMSNFVVLRLNDKGKLKERRIALNGPARELIKNSQKIEFIAANPAAMYLARLDSVRLFPDILPFDTKVLKHAYKFRANQWDRAAGKECQWVWLEPTDKTRYIQGFCLEKESKFPLVHVYLNSEKKLVEVNAFTEIEFVNPKVSEILGSTHLKVKDSIELPPKITKNQVKANINDEFIDTLPKHFFVIKRTDNQINQKNGRHYLIGDGLVTISLFIEEVNGEEILPESKQINGALSLVVKKNSQFKLTAVGDMPPKGLGLLLDKIKLKNQ